MGLRLIFAATAAALLALPAEGLLSVHGLQSVDGGDPKKAPSPAEQKKWLEQAAKANEELDKKTKAIMAELVNTSLKEADPKAKQEMELKMLEDLLSKWDAENETSVDETVRRMAAFAFRKAVRSHLRKPAKAEQRKSSSTVEVDAQTAEAMKSWEDEAKRATKDLEKQMQSEERDFGEAKEKGEEEKSLERLEDLLDGVDPKNASEMADLAAALAQERKRPKRKMAPSSSRDSGEAEAKMAEALKAWVSEANKESQDLEKQSSTEESDLGEAVPKGEEEKEMERLKDLIDNVDVKNASEMADLASALAQARRRPTRRAARQASQGTSQADSAMVDAMKAWMAEANKASQDMDKESSTEESDLGEAVPKGEEEKEMERLKELIDGVNVKNASEMADLASALAQAQVKRRPQRRSAPAAASQETSEIDAKMVEAMKAWVTEANKEAQDMDKAANTEESDLGEAVPKSEEEKELERVKDLLDSVNTKNASEMADVDLAAKLAQLRKRPKRKAAAQKRVMTQDVSEADVKMLEALKSWVAEANKESQDLDKTVSSEESDLGEAVPKGDEEKEMERLKDILDSVNPKNASEMADLDLAAALVKAKRRPKRMAAKGSSQMSEADSAMVEAMKAWMAEANKESRELEKETRTEENDLGEAIAKGAEEKEMERVKDLIDEVDAKNASELADLAAALAQARTLQAKLKPLKKPETERKADAKADAKTGEQMKAWMAEADKATGELDKEIDATISELSQEVPKGSEEKELERVQGLIDSVDEQNETQVADLAAKLAQDRSFTRKVGKPPSPTAVDWTEADTKKFWDWLNHAQKASDKLDKELDSQEKEVRDYLAGMTKKQERLMKGELKVLEEIWEKYGFQNESATAEDVVEQLEKKDS